MPTKAENDNVLITEFEIDNQRMYSLFDLSVKLFEMLSR